MHANIVTLGGGYQVRAAADAMVATREAVTLLTEFHDGTCMQGAAPGADSRRRIRRVSLTPGRARATPEAVGAIAGADTIVLGPASLYSGLLPTLLVRGIATAIAASRAPVVFVMNLMTEPHETDGYTGTDFVLALRRHVPQLPVAMTVLVNATPLPELVAARYARTGCHPVAVDDRTLTNLGCRVVRADLLADEPLARHDRGKLARALARFDVAGRLQ